MHQISRACAVGAVFAFGWVAAAQAQISVSAARIGCLDIQKDSNLTPLVGKACNGKWECSYKAPTEKEYKAAGVKARTRTFCTQGMEITWQCGKNDFHTAEVPGDAWNHPAADLDCRESAAYNAIRPGYIKVTEARIGCLDIQTEPNMTFLAADACDGKKSCSYKAPSEDQYRHAGVQAKTRTFCTQGMILTYQCGHNDFTTVTVPGDAWKHPPAPLDCNPPPSPLKGRFDPTGPAMGIVTLGDSIMWGQGLPEQDKFSTRVANWLQLELPNRRIVLVPTRAHSGAVSGFGKYPSETKGADPDTFYAGRAGYPYPGEVPFSYPSISHQISMTLADLPKSGLTKDSVGLVLLDSCINDVTVKNILNFTDVSTNAEWVAKITREIGVAHMASLLPQVLAAFPKAYVVITGYYEIVSDGTDVLLLAKYLAPLEIVLAGTPGVDIAVDLASKKLLVERSKAFADTAKAGLAKIVSDADRGMATPRVALAWPKFDEDNSYGGGETYLWKVAQYGGDEDHGWDFSHPQLAPATPQGVAYQRSHECRQSGMNSPLCRDASMGHPNILGAQAYTSAIIGQLLPLVEAP